MIQKIKMTKKDVFIIVLLISIICAMTYIHTNSPLTFKRLMIYTQMPAVKSGIRCSTNASDMLIDIMNLTIDQKSLNNQLVFISKNGELSHCESGWEDGYQGKRPITVDSRYSYASVTKVLTSAMILKLVNEGKLQLNDKLVDILGIKELDDPRVADIDVAMLLEHRAGFDRFKTYTPMLTAGKKPWCPTDLGQLSGVKLDFEPNTQFQYSNVGYCLLEAVIQKTQNKPYEQVADDMYGISQRGMKFIQDSMVAGEIEYDYRFEDFYGKGFRVNFDFKESLKGTGGLTGSAKAMALLLKELIQERPYNILSRSHNPCAISVNEGCFGYALKPYQATGSNYTLYNKDGHFPGVETDVFVDNQDNILVVYRGASVQDSTTLADFRIQIYHILRQNLANE